MISGVVWIGSGVGFLEVGETVAVTVRIRTHEGTVDSLPNVAGPVEIVVHLGLAERQHTD
jgi:hypothetical protein